VLQVLWFKKTGTIKNQSVCVYVYIYIIVYINITSAKVLRIMRSALYMKLYISYMLTMSKLVRGGLANLTRK